MIRCFYTHTQGEKGGLHLVFLSTERGERFSSLTGGTLWLSRD